MDFIVDNIRYGLTIHNKEVAVVDFLSNITDINIPSTVTYEGVKYRVTSIGDFVFAYCDSLTSITIGNYITSIGARSFLGCTCLTSVIIGDSVTSIEWYAFNGCTALTSVTIPNSVISIRKEVFCGTPFENIFDKLTLDEFKAFLNETDKFKYVSDGKLNLEDILFLLDKDEYCGYINSIDYGI